MFAGRIGLLGWSLALLSCSGSGSFFCGADGQCVAEGVGGLCQPNGFCSFPDDTCPSGQRFGGAAPATVAGQCVDEGPGSTGLVMTTSSAGVTTLMPTTLSQTGSGSTLALEGSSSITEPPGTTSSSGSTSASTTGLGTECPTQADRDTVALYRLDELIEATDEVGGHDGTWSGRPVLVDGPVGCGFATRLDGATHAVVPDAPDFHLTEGSLDVWVLLGDPPPARAVGIVSRDATQSNFAGHLTLWYGPTGRLAVRHQPIAGGKQPDPLVCSEPDQPQGTWVHVAVNFGAPSLELYVDGEPQMADGTVDILGLERSCVDGDTDYGIEGNDNPWAIGASFASSGDGTATPVNDFFTGAIDELRISSARRAF